MTDIQRETVVDLSLIVPVYNEETSVPVFLRAIADTLIPIVQALPAEAPHIEVIFIDDGSLDRTVEVIRAHPLAGVQIQLIQLSRNFGKDAALTAGLRHARGAAVIPLDVDLQDPPDLIPEMIRLWQQGALVVNAVRADRSTDTWIKRHSAALFYSAFNSISNYRISPNVGDFRLLDRKVVDTLNRLPEKVRFMKGLFSWVGYHTIQLPYTRPGRTEGVSKWKMFALWNFALDGITAASTLPLRIWTYIGGIMAVMAFGYSIYLVMRTMIFGVDVPGYASTMASILMFGSLNLMALGIIGEYVGRIAIEVRQRPAFVVSKVEQIVLESATQTKMPAPEETQT